MKYYVLYKQLFRFNLGLKYKQHFLFHHFFYLMAYYWHHQHYIWHYYNHVVHLGKTLGRWQLKFCYTPKRAIDRCSKITNRIKNVILLNFLTIRLTNGKFYFVIRFLTTIILLVLLWHTGNIRCFEQ